MTESGDAFGTPERLCIATALVDDDLVLRPWDASGLPLLIEGARDREVTRWTQVPAGLSMFEAGFVTAGWALAGSRYARFIACVDDGRPAGMGVAWTEDDAPDVAELGYWLLEFARGRGVGTRMVRLMCRWLFDTCGMSWLRITTIPGNEVSEALARRLGFHACGSLERDVKGTVRTLHLWVLKPDDFVRR